MESKKLVTVKELSEILNVPISWIYQKSCLKAIPMVKLGKYCRFDPEEVIAYFKSSEK
jgi:excisionase family DNA binding protein